MSRIECEFDILLIGTRDLSVCLSIDGTNDVKESTVDGPDPLASDVIAIFCLKLNQRIRRLRFGVFHFLTDSHLVWKAFKLG